MKKQNIAKLIEAIKVDGDIRFNMSTFLGKITNPSFKRENDLVHDQPTKAIPLNEIPTTNLFNCDSVGCIAGFATAVANDWKNPFLAINDDDIGNLSIYFEQAANDFLGLSEEEGKNLYYGDGTSIWKFLLWVEDDRFSELQLQDYETFDYYNEWDSNEISIALTTIKPKHAITLLEMLINDEIALSTCEIDESYNNYLNLKFYE